MRDFQYGFFFPKDHNLGISNQAHEITGHDKHEEARGSGEGPDKIVVSSIVPDQVPANIIVHVPVWRPGGGLIYTKRFLEF